MKQTNKEQVVEIRNSAGSLVGKYYPDKGAIEIGKKGCYAILTIPLGTPIQTEAGMMLSAK